MTQTVTKWSLGDLIDLHNIDGDYWGKAVIFTIIPQHDKDNEAAWRYRVTLVSDERISKPENDNLKVGDKLEVYGFVLKAPLQHLRTQAEDLRPVIRGIVQEELYSQLRKLYE